MRTRTTVWQAQSSQWLGSLGNPGNGEDRKELRRAGEAVGSSLQAHPVPEERALLRLDGRSGTGAVQADLLGLAFVTRGKDSGLLDVPAVQTRLHLPADQPFSRPERELIRTLSACPDMPGGASGQCCRLVVATPPKDSAKKRGGLERDGLVSERFLTRLPQEAFTASAVVARSLHFGAIAKTLSDEDTEQDPDRWCSPAACGQEAWQLLSPWVSPLRRE